jgi:hypothetical protein
MFMSKNKYLKWKYFSWFLFSQIYFPCEDSENKTLENNHLYSIMIYKNNTHDYSLVEKKLAQLLILSWYILKQSG